MDFRVLGPFEAVDGGVLELGGRRRRALLARLVLADGPVPEATLRADLFDRPDEATSVRLLRLHLDALGELLGPGYLVEGDARIELVRRAGESDAEAFLAEADAGLQARAEDDPEGAILLLRAANERWRGEVLEDLLPLPWADAVIASLNVERDRVRSALAELEGRVESARPVAPGAGVATVKTFLLTDVVDSTRRWEEAPVAMDEALIVHDVLLERIVADHGGALLKHRGEGDSTFSVFGHASDALAAAAAAQRALATARWPEGCALAVRAAVHTGEAVERGGDYFGPTVNRTARIRSLAQPGWVTISEATAELVRAELPAGLSLTALGPHVLRGIEQPEPLFLLVDDAAPLGPGPTRSGQGVGGWASIGERVRARSAPLAGRSEELARLEASLGASPGEPSVVAVVAGDAGIGKTRLVLELADAAERRSVVSAYGRCDDDVALPYQPFAMALNELVSRAPSNLLESYARDYGGELTRLVPGLARRVTWVPPPRPADAETERHLLFDAVVGFLAHVSRHQRVLLVLDDLHWAERQTLGLLRYVHDAIDSMSVLLVLAYRDTELPADGPIAELVGAVRRGEATTFVALRGLSGDDAVPLVTALTGRTGTEADELARRLASDTGGNPLFTLELLRHLVELEGTDAGSRPEELTTGALPDTVRGVIDRRVARLGAHAARVLQQAAVVGLEFDVDLVSSSLDVDIEVVLGVLEAARVAHLVEEAGRTGRFTFTHALVARALVQSRSAAGLERAHLRVAQAIEELHGAGIGPFLPDLATHLVAAGSSADPGVVGAVARQAGDLALAQLAPDEAARWYREALDRRPPGDDVERIDLLIALGTAQRQASAPEHRETLLEAGRVARAVGDPDRLAAAALANARGDRSRTYFVDHDRVGMLEAALAALGPADSPPRARLLAHLAQETIHTPDWGLRLARADEALAMARRLGDATTLVDVLLARYETTRVPHTLPARLAETAELVTLAEQLGDPLRTAFAHMWRSRAALEAGDIEGLDQHAQVAWALLDKVRNPYLRWNLTSHWTNRAILAGDLAEAERLALACFEAGKGQPDARAVLATHLLTIRAAQDRLSELVDAARADAARRPELAAVELALAWIHAQLGEVDLVVPTLDSHLADDFGRVLYDNLWITTIGLAAEAAARVGHAPAADRLLTLLSPWHDQIVWSGSSSSGPVSWLLGLLAMALGRFDAALAHLADARTTSERMGAPLWLAQVVVGEARAFEARGDHECARDSASLARELATRHGFAAVERDLRLMAT